MRVKRLYRIKKHKQVKLFKFIIFLFIIPFFSIVLGYIITDLIILPAIIQER